MKHLKWLAPIVLSLTCLFLGTTSRATCLTPLSNLAVEGPAYLALYTTGANNSCIDYYLDKSGNVQLWGSLYTQGGTTVNGTETNTGPTVYTPVSQLLLNQASPITPSASFYMVYSTGNVNYPSYAAVADPPISTSTAVNGQYVVLATTNSASLVTITTGTSTGITGENLQIVITSSMSPVGFLYNSTLSQWMEVGKQ